MQTEFAYFIQIPTPSVSSTASPNSFKITAATNIGGATPAWFQTVGIIFALSSGTFIGLSLVLQKKGLNDTEEERVRTGNEYEYLKSRLWWVGIAAMVMGELLNFLAYSFSPAIIVTPLGAVSVVCAAILSYIFLGEKMNFSGTMGILLCILGSVIIILHAPSSTQSATIPEFYSYVFSPGFLVFTFLCICLMVYLVFYAGPRWGHTQPIVYLSTTSLGGAFLVNAAQGFGSSVVYTIRNYNSDQVKDWNQFALWGIYPLMLFIACSATFQINYLNKSLQYFSTSIVTPVNYVFFSTATLITSAILFRGFNVANVVDGISIVLGFLVIVVGVSLLFQYNLKLMNKLKTETEILDLPLPPIIVTTVD
jgi:magnesium transporter